MIQDEVVRRRRRARELLYHDMAICDDVVVPGRVRARSQIVEIKCGASARSGCHLFIAGTRTRNLPQWNLLGRCWRTIFSKWDKVEVKLPHICACSVSHNTFKRQRNHVQNTVDRSVLEMRGEDGEARPLGDLKYDR